MNTYIISNRQRALTADLDQLARRLLRRILDSDAPDVDWLAQHERDALAVARRYAVGPAYLPAVRRFADQLGNDLLGANDEEDAGEYVARYLEAMAVLADGGGTYAQN